MYLCCMQHKALNKTFVLFTTFLFAFLSAVYSGNRENWEREINAIYNDIRLTDSAKIVRMGELTFDYGLYFRIIDDSVLEDYLHLTQPLVEKTDSDNLKIFFYKPMFLASFEAEDEKAFRENYIHIIHNSSAPLARFEGWMILGRSTIDESISLGYLFNALDEVKDTRHYREQAEAYQCLSYHYSQKNHANQLKYALQSVELAQQSSDVRQLIASWKELGTAYYEDPGNEYLNEALEAYIKARVLFTDKLNIQQFDIQSPESLHYMEVLVTIGSICLTRNQSREALENFEAALHIAAANNFADTQAFCHKELGILYQNLRQYSKAENHYITAQRLMESNSRNTNEDEHINYEIELQLADLYRVTGLYEASATHYETGIDQYRRMFDDEIIAENQRIRTYYEAQKQEQDIAGLKAIIVLKEKQKYYYWALAVIFVVVLFFIYRLFSYKIMTARQHEQQLRDEAVLLELDSANAELQARLRQEEADDLYRRITVSDELLEHKKRVLENLKRFFAGNPELNEYRNLLQKIFTRQERAEMNMGNIKTELQDVPMNFYSHLQKEAKNKLTSLDLKYCRLIYLGTSGKDMAEQLFVDIKTVRVTKYRIKQKLGLTKEENLQEFLINIISDGKEASNENAG